MNSTTAITGRSVICSGAAGGQVKSQLFRATTSSVPSSRSSRHGCCGSLSCSPLLLIQRQLASSHAHVLRSSPILYARRPDGSSGRTSGRYGSGGGRGPPSGGRGWDSGGGQSCDSTFRSLSRFDDLRPHQVVEWSRAAQELLSSSSADGADLVLWTIAESKAGVRLYMEDLFLQATITGASQVLTAVQRLAFTPKP